MTTDTMPVTKKPAMMIKEYFGPTPPAGLKEGQSPTHGFMTEIKALKSKLAV